MRTVFVLNATISIRIARTVVTFCIISTIFI